MHATINIARIVSRVLILRTHTRDGAWRLGSEDPSANIPGWSLRRPCSLGTGRFRLQTSELDADWCDDWAGVSHPDDGCERGGARGGGILNGRGGGGGGGRVSFVC